MWENIKSFARTAFGRRTIKALVVAGLVATGAVTVPQAVTITKVGEEIFTQDAPAVEPCRPVEIDATPEGGADD